MLPGLVLTVGLVAQSIGAMVTPANRNPDAPRFVNIGDDIIQSSTAKPIAPAGTCAPVAAEPPATVVVHEYVIVQAPPEDAEDPPATTEEPQVANGVEPFTVYPFTVTPFSRRPPVRLHPHPVARHVPQPLQIQRTLQPVLLPSMPTVLLPPTPTVLLPVGFTPLQRSR
jgi:hypothetical protein